MDNSLTRGAVAAAEITDTDIAPTEFAGSGP